MKNCEFGGLYIFATKKAEPYIQVIETLASSTYGMSRDEIVEKTKITSDSQLPLILRDLENCDFIRHFRTRGKKIRENQHIYQIIDMFTMFHFRF